MYVRQDERIAVGDERIVGILSFSFVVRRAGEFVQNRTQLELFLIHYLLCRGLLICMCIFRI